MKLPRLPRREPDDPSDQATRAYMYCASQMWENMRGLVDAYKIDSAQPWHDMPPWDDLTEFQQVTFVARMRPAFGELVDAISAVIA